MILPQVPMAAGLPRDLPSTLSLQDVPPYLNNLFDIATFPWRSFARQPAETEEAELIVDVAIILRSMADQYGKVSEVPTLDCR
jgi:hypothetical protein